MSMPGADVRPTLIAQWLTAAEAFRDARREVPDFFWVWAALTTTGPHKRAGVGLLLAYAALSVAGAASRLRFATAL